MFDNQTEILLEALPILSKITGGYATLTDSKGNMITNYDYQGNELSDFKGKLYEMALRCINEKRPLIGPAQYAPNCTALAIPIGDNVLVSTDTQRVRIEANLKMAIINALPYISQIVGGTVSICDKTGTYTHSCDSKGNHVSLPKPSSTAKKAIESMEPIVKMSRTMEGVQNVYIPITKDCCLKLNNATTVAKSSMLLEEVKKLQNTRYNFTDIIGESTAIKQAIDKARKIASSNSTVMLFGETGTGKELFAQSIHNFSSRGGKPFIAINCAALPASLIESNLFGYESGAFTGAKKEGMPGSFEQANGGTLFLDEISEMDLNSQSKLLRVIQEKEVTRIGGSKAIPIDVRIVCATNRNLLEMVKRKEFREDLFYRLNVIHIDIPPLRNRTGDITLLANYFLKKYSFQIGKSVSGFSDEVLEALESCDWQGNIRELENNIEYAVNMVDYTDEYIKLAHLPRNISSQTLMKKTPSVMEQDKTLKDYVEEYEKEVIIHKLNELDNNNSLVAEQLGLSVTTLWRKMKRYNLL